VHVDVDVELPRDLEDAVDLAARIAVGVRRRADRPAPSRSACTSSASVPGLLISPSCGKTQSCRSIAQA